jgi:ribosomal protein L19E
MTKNMEDLADKNATLLAQIPEQSHMTTIVRDANIQGEKDVRGSHTSRRREEDENPNPNREGSGDQEDHREAHPKTARPWKEKKEKLRDVISKLEKR